MRPAGWGTENSEGRCKFHGGATPTKTGRYSVIKRKRIAELLEDFRSDPDPLDVTEELHLLRALVLDYVERYDEMTDLLQAWHNSYGPTYLAAIQAWRLEYAEWREKMTDIYEDGWQEIELATCPNLLPRPTRSSTRINPVRSSTFCR